MANKLTQRFEMLVGQDSIHVLRDKRVIVFGVGGVGGQAAESLVRSGIGHITIVDRDIVDETNINRQVVALVSAIGKVKVDVLKSRLLDINPLLDINAINGELTRETLGNFGLDNYDFIVDAIDSVKDKIALIEYCYHQNLPLISSMGAGNRLDPTAVYITDIFKTSYDPLAKVIRAHLRKNNIKKLSVVTSEEAPKKTIGKTPTSSP
jgi:tRNA A37 threonylcarbamoyladenosine dehydratase